MPEQITGCPPWEYNTIPNYQDALLERSEILLVRIRENIPPQNLLLFKDTRPTHAFYLAGLTPPDCAYYAGHYRGENYLCLLDYQVGISGDSSVGHDSRIVPMEMDEFSTNLENSIGILDNINADFNPHIGRREKFIRTIQVATALFVYFLEIHPYANGNGHVARFLLIGILLQFGISLTKWNIHPRPADPPYSSLIAQYRQGNKTDLEMFVMNSI